MIEKELQRNVYKFEKIKDDDKYKIKITEGKLSDISQGDIFFMEEPDGELVVTDDGEFIFKAEDDPEITNQGFLRVTINAIS